MADEQQQPGETQPEVKQPEPGKTSESQDPKVIAAAKVEADRLAAEAKQTEADDAREAEIDKRAAAKAQKLAAKLADEKIAAKEAETKTKAEREKMDAVEKAKLEAKESSEKLAASEARVAAAELKAELAEKLVTSKLTPANPAAFEYIRAAVAREMAAGAEDVEKALAKVARSETFLFAAAATPGQQPTKTKPNTAGNPAGGGERPAPGDDQRRPQYKTPEPKEIDPTDHAALRASIRERHGFTPLN